MLLNAFNSQEKCTHFIIANLFKMHFWPEMSLGVLFLTKAVALFKVFCMATYTFVVETE